MEKHFEKYFKGSIAVIIILFLFLPLFQSKSNLLTIKPLYGDTVVLQKPVFSAISYFDSQWQEETSQYLNRNFGFRNLYVRLFNQIRLSCFNKPASPGIVVGKNGDLIIEDYINEYIGKNFAGRSHIGSIVRKIKAVQDSLKARGTDLIIVFAPGRASYDPEIIPDSYLEARRDSTNYSVHSRLMHTNHINYIDLNSWFSSNKNSFRYKVYPRYGAHWNHYGMCLALDTILKYIEAKQKIDLPDFDFSEVRNTSDLKGNDFDIGILMNTLFPLQKDTNPYPVYKIRETGSQTKPDVLVVGDSYWWCLVGENLPLKFFKEDEYWFYNKQQLIRNRKTNLVKKLNRQTAILNRKAIILIASEATYYLFPYGFIDDVYKLICEDHSKRLNEITKSIYSNTEWYNSIQKKAVQNNITVEKQIKLDAEYVLSDELFNPRPGIDSIIKLINNNKDWMEDIRKKAANNNISIREQVELDAKWYLDNQNK